jgi:hypothetical protein
MGWGKVQNSAHSLQRTLCIVRDNYRKSGGPLKPGFGLSGDAPIFSFL